MATKSYSAMNLDELQEIATKTAPLPKEFWDRFEHFCPKRTNRDNLRTSSPILVHVNKVTSISI